MARKPAKSKELATAAQPLIRLDKHQEAVFWSELRTLFLLWRRQDGKSFTLGAWSFRRMAQLPGHLVILCSASIALGKEWIYKEAQVWRIFTQAYRELLAAQGTDARMLTTAADDDKGRLLDVDAIADLFEHQKLETRLWHSNSIYSRSMVAAPNPDTAVGWTGDVGMDEVGRIDCLKELLEALGPIMTRNKLFRMRMATTISPDDTHYSREIHGVRIDQGEFPIMPAGNFYQSKSGYMVHRHDAYDAYAAGLKLYDDKTGEEVTPEQHRANSLDKSAWDRNYGLLETVGGTAAISAAVLTRCLTLGKGQCLATNFTEKLTIDGIGRLFPQDWQQVLDRAAPRLRLGVDIATTTNKKSNPSSITLLQQVGLGYLARLILRFKADDPAVLRAAIEMLLNMMPSGMKVGGLEIDATSEKFFAVELRRYFRGRLPVNLIVSSETTEYKGERLTLKTFMGDLAINTADDGYLALPPYDWLEKDWRSVKKEKGLYYADIDESGNHADTFDSTKLALFGMLKKGGPVVAEAAAVGSMGGPKPDRLAGRDPFARRFPKPPLHV